MKNRFSGMACAILALALVVAVGSVTFLSPCVHEDGGFGPCHWAGRALLGVGALLAALAILSLLHKSHPAKAALYLSMVPAAVLGILTPGVLIDLCRMSTMRCRALMQPAMMLLCALILLLALAGWLLERKRARSA